MSLKVKILFLLVLSTLTLNASIYYGAKNLCIDDYYINVTNEKFCFQTSNDGNWNCTSVKNQVETLIPNYIYDQDSGYCRPNTALYFGLEQTQFNFLMALSGLLVGLIILVSSVFLVFNVGGKR